MENRKLFDKKVIEQSSELERLISTWNLIPGSPEGEFISLSNQIISQLYKDPDKQKISNIIFRELSTYYGLKPTKKDSSDLAHEVAVWWQTKR